MAEAHQGVAFNFAITHEGVHINYDTEVLSVVWQSGVRSNKKRFARFINNFKNGVYPSSLEFLAFILVTVISSKFFLSIDPSFGIIDWFDSAVFLPYISPSIGLNQRTSLLLSCLVFGISLWIAKAFTMRYTVKLLLMYKGWMYARRGSKPSLFQRIWVTSIKALTYKKAMLYSYQASLPRLPLPSLHETLTRYLRSVKPLESEEDYRRLEKEAEDFEHGIGKKLQRYLVLKSWWASNYVSDWWEEYVYLRGRQPIMVNSNYYAIDALFINHTNHQSSRAANLVYSAMMFRRMIDRQELTPIMVQGLVPLCSWQYERLFNTTRLPGIEGDRLHHLNDSQHIVIMHRGRYFRLDLYYKQKLLLPKQLETLIEKILNDKTPPSSGEDHLGALTAADRVTWAETRINFFAKGINRISLNAIENAAFVLVLDDENYEFKRGDDTGLSRTGQILLHGKGYDRWFDKSFNLIISKNGRAGFNAEHSWADAPIMAHLWEFILSYELENLGYDSEGRCVVGNGNGVDPPAPLRLKWDVPEELTATIENCRIVAQDLLNDVDLRLMVFTDYGKGFIKTCKVSPDAYVQLAFQLAYFRGCGKFCLTYEASMTRLFREGRTETVRPVTCESAAFVRAMNDRNMSKKEKIALMKTASEVHQRGYQDAMCGKGIDRHLFCLYVISKYLEVDSPFLKEILSEPWKLSTSQTPHGQANLIDFRKHPECISAGGGFGPVADDGYGVSYIVAGEETIFFHISSKKSSPETDSDRFANSLKEALHDMKALFDAKK